MRRRLVALMAVLAIAALPGVAGAQEADATVYVVHGVPDAVVNVTAAGDAIISDFEFGTVETLSLPAGTYPIGLEFADGSGVIYEEADVTVEAGGVYAAIAHLNEDGSLASGLAIEVIDTSAIAAGEARVSAFHYAGAPAVDVVTGDTVLFDAVPNGASGALDVPAATYPVSIVADADNSVVALPPTDIDLAEGTNTLVFAVGVFPDTFTPLIEVVSGLGESPEGVPSGEGPLGALDATLAVAALALGAGALGLGRTLSRRGA
jgi:hypothetical protein